MLNRFPWKSQGSLVITLMVLSGCLTSEAEHADHEIPAHKPEHFVAAVEQITERIAAPKNAEQQQQLIDLIGWLPELGAQTELPKSDWDRIHELTLDWQKLASQPASMDEAILSNLSELQAISARAVELDTFNTYGQKADQ